MERFLYFSNLEIILLAVTLVLFITELLYYLISFRRPYKMREAANREESGKQPPVSVIVYTKNESYNLKKYLPSLLEQDYPQYEVIVINDGSTDESDDVLKILENQYNNLYHTFIPQDSKYLSRRKLALTIGIKAAKYKYLLFTEANCQPSGKNWIRAMVRNYTSDQTDIVLGFCAYRHYKGLIHKLISYDNLMCGLEYISSALKNHPFSGNGRNLSYTRDLFFQHKGYSKSLSLHAGDDDLFVNEAANSRNTKVEYSKDSITEMAVVEYFSVWKEMKVSRASTQHHYTGRQLLHYRVEKAASVLFLLAAIATVVCGLLYNPVTAGAALLLYLILFAVKTVTLKKSARMLRQKIFAGYLPLLEIIRPLMSLYVHIYRGFRGKKDYTFTIPGK